MTLPPAAFCTGTLSPVSMLSFTALLPSVTSPSVGMRSPGRTSTTSPTTKAVTFTSTMLSPSFLWASAGNSCTNSSSACEAPATDFISR